jgi:hypothetical protein
MDFIYKISILGILACCVLVSAQRRPPNYSQQNMPVTSFSCRDKIIGGYYADPETDCQMFHVCVKVPGQGIQDYKFLCPNDTSFDQENQICDDWYNIDCEASTLFYSDNFDLYRIGSDFESTRPRVGPKLPAININNAVSDHDEDYLQRSDRGENVGSDILRGSHSGNFFSNKNGGKEDDDVPREEYHSKNKRPAKTRKLLTGKRPVPTSTEAAPVYQEQNRQASPSPSPRTFNNNYSRNQFRGNSNFRQTSTTTTTTTTAAVPSRQTETYNYNQRQNAQRNYYTPTTPRNDVTQNYNTAQQTEFFKTSPAQKNYPTQKAFQNSPTPGQTYNPTTIRPAQNYYTPTTQKPTQNYYNPSSQSYNPTTTTQKANYYENTQNYNSQSTGNYNNNFDFAKQTTQKQNYYNPTTIRPSTQYYTTTQRVNYNPQNNQNFNSQANQNYNANTNNQNYNTQQTTTNYNAQNSQNFNAQNNQNFNAQNKNQNFNTQNNQNYNAPTQNYNVATSPKPNPFYNQQQFSAQTTQKPLYQQNYIPTTQRNNYFNNQANNQPSNAPTTQRQNYNQRFGPSSSPAPAFSTKQPFQNYNIQTTTRQNFNQYNPSSTPSYEGSTVYDTNYETQKLFRQNVNAASNFPSHQPEEDEFLKTAHSQNLGASNLNRVKNTLKSLNTSVSSSYNFAQDNKGPQVPKGTARPPPPAPTTVQTRGGANYARTTDATERPRPFTITPPAKTEKTKEKDSDYDYAYYDDRTGSEYDNIETLEEFSRTRSKSG